MFRRLKMCRHVIKSNNKDGGHKVYEYGGHPAPTGPALPNLINAVSILKSTCLSRRSQNRVVVLILTLNILTAFIKLGRARPAGAGCPP